MNISRSIKRVLRDAVCDDFKSSVDQYLQGLPVVKAFDGEELQSKHIRIATPSATPHRVGDKNLGIWTVTVSISAVTQIDASDNDEHDNLAGLIEWYALQGNAELKASISNNEIEIDNVFAGNAMETAIGAMRYSSQELEIECYMKAGE